MKKTFLLLLLLVCAFSAEARLLSGYGYGQTEEEAKKEALADLASVVKVRVYSKYEQTADGSEKGARVESTRFTRLISNVQLINPEVVYARENGMIKATAVINNPESYLKRLEELAERIDHITDFGGESSKDLVYRRLENAMPLYDEYESYRIVPLIMGIDDYRKPALSSELAKNMLLEMQTLPPSLEIAAEVLAKPMTGETDIYVSPPLVPGTEEITPFARFFKEILEGKIKAVKNKPQAKNTLNCLYSESDGGIVMSCSLVSPGGTVSGSSLVKIPAVLLTKSAYRPASGDLMSLIKSYDSAKSDLKASIKITSDGNPAMLRAGDECTILVKANKPSYLYIVGYTQTPEESYANVLLLGINDAFIKPVRKEDVGKWLSLGRFKIYASGGTETLQLFALEKAPEPSRILPDYAIGHFGPLKVKPEKAAEDFLYLFSRQKGEKSVSTVTYTVLGEPG